MLLDDDIGEPPADGAVPLMYYNKSVQWYADILASIEDRRPDERTALDHEVYNLLGMAVLGLIMIKHGVPANPQEYASHLLKRSHGYDG